MVSDKMQQNPFPDNIFWIRGNKIKIYISIIVLPFRDMARGTAERTTTSRRPDQHVQQLQVSIYEGSHTLRTTSIRLISSDMVTFLLMDNIVIFNDLNPQTWPRRAGGMDVRPGVVKKETLSRCFVNVNQRE